MKPLNKLAFWSGISYLIIFFTAIFSNFFVFETLIDTSNAQATLKNISENQLLFRVGTFSFLITIVFDILLAATFFSLFKPVHKLVSLLGAWFRLAHAFIFGTALFLLMQISYLIQTASPHYTQDQLASMVLESFTGFNYTWLLALFFFGFHLLILGYLAVKATNVPAIIGYLLALAGLGYIIDTSANILLSNYADYADMFLLIVAVPGIIGEFTFTLWLLFKGSRRKTFTNE